MIRYHNLNICKSKIKERATTFPLSMGRVWLVLVSILVSLVSVKVNAQITYVNTACQGVYFNYTQGSVYDKNINSLFSILTSKSSSLKFNNSIIGDASNKVYGFFQCRYDISFDTCNECVATATRKIIEVCSLFGEAIIWYHECTLRYANRNIFSSSELDISATQFSKIIVSNYAEFVPVLETTITELINNASSSLQHFDSSVTNWTTFEQLYSFAQCIPTISTSACNRCLRSAFSAMRRCCNASELVIFFFPSCQLRYGMSPFLKDHSSRAPPPTIEQGLGTGKKAVLKPAIIGAIAGGGSVGLIVLFAAMLICLRRNRPKEASGYVPGASSPTGLHDDLGNIGDRECVQYDFTILENATKGFSDENKLGEGGFGSVYKGTLENGEQLAIKRLSGTWGQGSEEFLTEVRLLAKLQHRNLIKLDGFCLEGEEKLLVYEYMSNSSLDKFLFDSRKKPLLDWVLRYQIIMGIARGLQYLHEDSRLTIVHRDLKPPNVLLDDEMNPKIADFGSAKLFGGAEKSGNTLNIVGTLGYMAPEYLTTGDYSDKSDVYSFGVLLLEIVSGQRNRVLNKQQQKEDLSVQAWRLWNENRSFEIIDPLLLNNCSSNDVMRCIQIGLLCLQENPEERPTMALVVFMLTGTDNLPVPSTSAMFSNQFNMPRSHSGGQQSGHDHDHYSTNSGSLQTTLDQDLYPAPR